MTRTTVIFSPIYFRHNPGRDHPESAKRLSSIITEFKKGQLSRNKNWAMMPPQKASVKQIEMVHDKKYINYVKRLCKTGGGLLDKGDTRVSRESFEVALHAAGGAIEAVDQVMKGQSQNSLALVRPPGHHAARFYGLGFCLFNNIAIAACHLLQDFKLKRILIIDIDSHHGNGTQSIFYESPKVLYISLHEDPTSFPGTGFTNEIGEHDGQGFTVNIPLPLNTGDQIYMKAMKEIIIPIAHQYRPQFILVSAGLDAHYADPVGRLALSTKCYGSIFETITNVATELCNGRLSLVLEGGYNTSFIGELAGQALGRMVGARYLIQNYVPMSSQKIREKGRTIIEEVKKTQRNFWNVS